MDKKPKVIDTEAAAAVISRNKPAIFDLIVFAVIALSIYLIRGDIANVITPFIYGLILAYLLNPLIKLLERKIKNRIVVILLVFLAFAGVITTVIALFLPRLIRDVSGFADEIPRAIDFIIKTAEEIRDGRLTIIPEQVLGWIDIDKEMARIADVVKQSLADFSGWLIASGSKLLDLIMTPIITFYYLKDKELIRETILGAFKPEGRNRAVEIAGDVDKVIGGFIRGQITVAAFVGVLTGLGCMIIGVPHALTIGVVAGLTNIIPYFGPWLGGIMPVILALMEKPLMALWVVILIVAVQQIEASFISPQIMSHNVGLHPLLVMFSVLLFGSVLGIPGMIIGVPLMATLKVLWSHKKKYRQRYEKKKKILSPDEYSFMFIIINRK